MSLSMTCGVAPSFDVRLCLPAPDSEGFLSVSLVFILSLVRGVVIALEGCVSGTEVKAGKEPEMTMSGEVRGEGRLEGNLALNSFFVRVEGAFLVDGAWCSNASRGDFAGVDFVGADSVGADFVGGNFAGGDFAGEDFCAIASRKRSNPFPLAVEVLLALTCRALTNLEALRLIGVQSSSAA